MNTVVRIATDDHQQPVDTFFSASEARSDRWRELNAAAASWASAKNDGQAAHVKVQKLFHDLAPMEEFLSFPGPGLMRSLRECLDLQDRTTFARLGQKIGRALLSNSYQHDPAVWDALQDSQSNSAHALPPDADGTGMHKPNFDVLIVTPNAPERWDETRRQLQRLRRREDPFTYNVVMVGSFEDAAIATVLNESIQAVVIYDGFSFSSRHDAPLLHDHLTRYGKLDAEKLAAEGKGLGTHLAALVKSFRPELD